MELTIQEIIKRARHFSGNTNQVPVRDGFDDDPAAYLSVPLTYIEFVNDTLDELLATGYLKCDFSFQITAGQREYGSDPWLHQYVAVWYNGRPLKRTTIGKLDRDNPGWRLPTAARGTPTEFYWYSDQIGLNPVPDTTDGPGVYSLVVRADSDLTKFDGTDRDRKPKRLPSRFHRLLSVGAAIRALVNDPDNEAHWRKMGWLNSQFKEGKAQLLDVVQQRDLDQEDQIEPLDYRDGYRS
jgi:hypothetical protein